MTPQNSSSAWAFRAHQTLGQIVKGIDFKADANGTMDVQCSNNHIAELCRRAIYYLDKSRVAAVNGNPIPEPKSRANVNYTPHLNLSEFQVDAVLEAEREDAEIMESILETESVNAEQDFADAYFGHGKYATA